MTDPVTPTTRPGTNATYSIDDQIKEAKRELNMRHAVYRRRHDEGKMTWEQLQRGIALQQAIIDTLTAVKAWHWPDKQGGLGI